MAPQTTDGSQLTTADSYILTSAVATDRHHAVQKELARVSGG